MTTTKRCSRCQQELPTSEFYASKRSWCKTCQLDYNRQMYALKKSGYHRLKQATDAARKAKKARDAAIVAAFRKTLEEPPKIRG